MDQIITAWRDWGGEMVWIETTDEQKIREAQEAKENPEETKEEELENETKKENE